MGDNAEALSLFGRYDQHLRTIEQSLPVRLVSRGNELIISGPREEVDRAAAVFDYLLDVYRSAGELSSQDVAYALRLVRSGHKDELGRAADDIVLVTGRGKPIRPKTLGQKRYVEAMRSCGIVFGIGPAGTGKTYLAVAMAIAAFKERSVNRIILTRPAVEAGERLGFLPGDLQEKVNPYLRPLYDALYDMLGMETFEKYMGRGLIEVAPLAY
ncbi:MAG: PhoH family protein, partial [Acetobacteraceae bacterium]|nr:PhoH family protein [Acetobacteraceae bacterium]